MCQRHDLHRIGGHLFRERDLTPIHGSRALLETISHQIPTTLLKCSDLPKHAPRLSPFRNRVDPGDSDGPFRPWIDVIHCDLAFGPTDVHRERNGHCSWPQVVSAAVLLEAHLSKRKITLFKAPRRPVESGRGCWGRGDWFRSCFTKFDESQRLIDHRGKLQGRIGIGVDGVGNPFDGIPVTLQFRRSVLHRAPLLNTRFSHSPLSVQFDLNL